MLKHRLNIEELTKTEHDLYMMGVTMACVGQTEKTAHKKERKKLRARYRFMVITISKLQTYVQTGGQSPLSLRVRLWSPLQPEKLLPSPLHSLRAKLFNQIR